MRLDEQVRCENFGVGFVRLDCWMCFLLISSIRSFIHRHCLHSIRALDTCDSQLLSLVSDSDISTQAAYRR